MVNVNKLKGKIVECEMNISDLALKIGVDRATLYRKFNNDGETFTVKEVDMIAKELDLDLKEFNSIFFSQYVA
ncbi:MAG: helix-turn-helix transcriptional regulator [Bacillota bacterium]|nr:helix-turn-helix transcriptional regulator [Bacillota bacterium]